MDLLQTLLVYMSLVFATSVQTAPEPSAIPDMENVTAAYTEVTPEPTAAPTPVPTINITPNPAYKTLQMGDRGVDVRTMQEKLQEYGYYQGEIDGAYGNQSRQAVENFQYMHGLVVDGIAGRHTLTVLYESTEIRLPQGGEAAVPTPETQLAVAITPTPTPKATLIPVMTFVPVPTASPTKAPAFVEEPQEVEQLEGYTVLLNNDTVDDALVFRRGETLYLPVLKVLEEAGIHVISSLSLEMDEYAFAAGERFVRFTHTENQQGQPVDLQVYSNDEPQLVPDRTLYRAGDVLYMPEKSLEKMADFVCTADHEQKCIHISTTAE